MTAQPNIKSIVAAVPAPLHVVIIGGGIGGLTLAQGLKKSGVSVAVYERDRTRTDRVQGYRVHINPTGGLALHECLPTPLFDAFARTCGKPTQGIRFVTERMKVLLSLDELNTLKHSGGDGVAQHRSVSRITLRQVLLSGLDDVVHFGKTFVRYEELPAGRIRAHFEDGTTAEGDVLVAADGGGSRVRRQYLPHAERVDTGVVGIAGKVFLDDDSRQRIAPELRRGLTLAPGRGGYALFVALQEIDGVDVKGFGGNDEFGRGRRAFRQCTQLSDVGVWRAARKIWFRWPRYRADGWRGASQRRAGRDGVAVLGRALSRPRAPDGLRDDQCHRDPHVCPGRTVALGARHAPRRRHSFDDAVSRHWRQCRT